MLMPSLFSLAICEHFIRLQKDQRKEEWMHPNTHC